MTMATTTAVTTTADNDDDGDGDDNNGDDGGDDGGDTTTIGNENGGRRSPPPPHLRTVDDHRPRPVVAAGTVGRRLVHRTDLVPCDADVAVLSSKLQCSMEDNYYFHQLQVVSH